MLRLTIASLFAVLAALAFFVAFGLPRAACRTVQVLCGGMIFFSPCLVPVDMPLPRFVAALVAVTLLVKAYDVAQASKREVRIDLASYVAYLTNGYWLVLLRPPTTPSRASNLRTAVYNLPAFTISAFLSIVTFQQEWSAVPIFLEHGCKVILVFSTTVSLANLSAALWRLAGGVALNPMNRPELGQTPAMFWRRWNQPAQQFFCHHVYLPSGGNRTPIRATFVTFFVSGLVHEYVFGMAANRVQGWQLLFFMLQGCAAAATMRFKPQKQVVPFWIAGTILFNLATSVFFFKSVNMLFPFYSPRNA